MKPFLSPVVLLLAATTTFAQTPPAPTTLTDEIVVTASALPETVESTPAAVTVITREDIDRQQARDVADLLREVPGVIVARSGSAGKATSMFTRGAASTQTLVLWNGIEINNPYFSGYDWGRFSTAGVDRIEIVRGPFSALYGSEAMAGVVNVFTTPRKSALHVDIARGGEGLQNALIDGAWVSPTAQLSGAYEHRQDDGFDPNDDFSQNTASALAKWMPSQAFSVGIAARHTTYDEGIPFNTNADATALVPSLSRRQDGHETQVSIPIAFTLGRFVNELTFSDSRRRDDFEDPADPFITGSTTDSKTGRAHLATHFSTPVGTLVAGGEYERAVVNDVTNFGANFEDARRTSRSFFAEDRYSRELGTASRLELSAGVRYDKFDVFGSQTSPRAAIAILAGSNKFRAAYGHGFRAPSLGELYFPFFGNPDLTAERSRSFEVGYDHTLRNEGLFSATYFNSRYKQLITFDPTTFVSENIGRVRSDGVELGLQQRTSANTYAAISYTYLRRNEDEATHERLLRRPKHSGSLVLGYRSGAIDTNIVVLRSGARLDTEPVAPFGHVTNAGYTTVDVNLQYRSGKWIPYVKLENATDRKYEEVLGFRSPRRRMIVGLRVAL
ncbi:MAG TPA: TonB-dependent receptor [Thermoanaerobaculia bacterium]|nr:TonB-dependent receptor [Thermoanaerobaculia bacterium]